MSLSASFTYMHTQLSPLWLGAAAAGVVLGGGAGFLMSRHQHLSIDYDTGALTLRISPIGVLVLMVILVARFGLRTITGGAAPDAIVAHGAQIGTVADALMLFLLAMYVVQAWEIGRRAKTLLAEHAARQPTAPTPATIA
jgi:hypothetical protein